MATGRDASDVAITTAFGQADLVNFLVVSEEETAPINNIDRDSLDSMSTPTLSA
jgi:hypothetical protein